MPRSCSVFGCRSNYKSEKTEHISTFNLPVDLKQKTIWIRKIPNDISKLKRPQVCIKHFCEKDIIRIDKCLVNGELKEFPRERPKLAPDAIPSIFENDPKYFSKPPSNVVRLADVENDQMEAAIKASLSFSLAAEKTELLVAIKNEPPESKIGVDIPNSLDEQIIPDIKDIDIVSHELSEDLIKSETVAENTFENNHSGSVETQVFVKTENIPLIKTENITPSEYLYKTQDTSDGNVNRGTSQGVIEVQGKEGSNEHFDALQSDKQFVNFFKDLSDINRKAIYPNKTDFSECYQTVETTSCEKDREKRKIIEIPVIPIEPHKYTSLAKAKHACNKNKSSHEQNKKRYCCEKCMYISERSSDLKRHQLTHKTKAEMDDRLLKYRCDKCKYKTYVSSSLKKHKLTHLKPEEIHYFYCYHCSYKSKHKAHLKTHIFRHFKNEDVQFHCYICDFTTLKRNLIIEHFKKHPKHLSKCDETDYKNQIKIPYFYCYHCSYKCIQKDSLKTHIFSHFKRGQIPFHCYICDFVTLKRDLIIKHFKKHPKHHSKCDETDYKNQLETYTKKLMRYSCGKCMYTCGQSSDFKLHQLTHKTKAEIDDRLLKYRCDKCKYKTYWCTSLKRHKLKHLKPEQIPYFNCYHCPYKCKEKGSVKKHIFNHFKKEEVPFHCYICDFTTLKRNLIIEHFKKHPKHHSKCDETDYKNQLEILYFYCYHCPYKCKQKGNLKIHIFNHFKKEEVPFHCYICDFMTLKRNLIIEHFKKHLKHQNNII